MATCETCKANKVCDHNKYGFENCNNHIPEDVVEVKRGEWLPTRTDDFVYIEQCSLCKYIEAYNIDPDNNISSNYCPNCGAEMGGTPKERGGEK